MGVNKVILGERTLVDLSADTVTADKLASGYTAHNADGELITGTLESTATISVVSIASSGEYDDVSHHGEGYAAIDSNGNLFVIVNGGTSTSYEAIRFETGSVPAGVALVNQSNTTDTSATSGAAYVGIFNGITTSVSLELVFDGTNSTNDYTICTVNITEVM